MDQRDLPLRLWQRDCRRTEPRATGKVFGNTALSGNDRIVVDGEMTDYPDLSGHLHILTDACAPRNSGLRRDDGIFSNDHVMSNLNEVIDLYTFLDPRSSESSSVNRRVGANLYFVIDLDDADLWNFFVAAVNQFKSKTVRADNRATVNDDPRADPRSFANSHVRVDYTRRADHGFVSNVAARSDDGFVADGCVWLDDSMRLNRDPASEFRSWIDDRAGMDSGRELDRRRRKF